MADELDPMWGKLTLTEEEKEEILVVGYIVGQIIDTQAMVNQWYSYLQERKCFF
jgi:hypothetical protein